jgi:hypothetical protein
MISPSLALKPVATISSGLASKLVATVLVVWPQNHSLGFLGLGLKPAAVVWWFGPQNHCNGFLICASKPYMFPFVGCVTKSMKGVDARHTSRSSGLLHLKASLVEAWWWMVHVVSLRRLCWVEAEDRRVNATDCVIPFYPKIVVCSVLGHRRNLIF